MAIAERMADETDDLLAADNIVAILSFGTSGNLLLR